MERSASMARDRARHRPALTGCAASLSSRSAVPRIGPVRAADTVGVDVFFVLSGFLITTLLVAEIDTAGRVDVLAPFYVRRGLRLLPALLLFVVACCLLVVTIRPNVYRTPTLQGAPYVLSYLANVHQAFGWDGGRLCLFDATWSLSMEEQFYVLWPVVLVAMLALVRHRRQHAALVLLGDLARDRVAPALARVRWRGMGAVVVRARRSGRRAADRVRPRPVLASPSARSPRRSPAAGAVSAAGTRAHRIPVPGRRPLPVLGFWCDDRGGLPPGACCGALVSGTSPRLDAIFSWRPLRSTGRISYGLYLWHFPIVFALGAAGAWAWGWWVAAPIEIGLSYAAAAPRSPWWSGVSCAGSRPGSPRARGERADAASSVSRPVYGSG